MPFKPFNHVFWSMAIPLLRYFNFLTVKQIPVFHFIVV